MRRSCGAVIVAVAALIVCCSADPHREQDVSGNDQSSGKRYDVNDYRQTEEYEDFLRFLMNYGGASMLGRNFNGHLGKNTGAFERNYGRNPPFPRDPESDRVARFVDSLGGGNFVRNLDSLGGGNFVRNLDSIGGGNFVKKNLDQLGGPNLVKRNLDSLGGGNFVRNLDSLGGGNFVRQLDPLGGHKNRISHPMFEAILPDGSPRSLYAVNLLKMLDYNARSKDKYPLSPLESSFYYGGLNDDYVKRRQGNFDEIDRSNMDQFMAKRNFDEIDRSSLPFPYGTKRFYHLYGSNYLNLDTPVSSFDKKRYRPDYPMDEIDLSHFPIGSKRSQNYPMLQNLQ